MKLRETAALLAQTAAIGWMVHAIPSWQNAIADPCVVGTLCAARFTAFLWVNLLTGSRGGPKDL